MILATLIRRDERIARYIVEGLLNFDIYSRQALNDAKFEQINNDPNCRPISFGDE
jgi:hypothetical protein